MTVEIVSDVTPGASSVTVPAIPTGTRVYLACAHPDDDLSSLGWTFHCTIPGAWSVWRRDDWPTDQESDRVQRRMQLGDELDVHRVRREHDSP